MCPSRLRGQPFAQRLALAALLLTGLAGWGISLQLAASRLPGGFGQLISPSAAHLRCALPLERALATSMRQHLTDPAERRVIKRWISAGAPFARWGSGPTRMPALAPARVIARRCGSCHGPSAQGGIRLATYADVRSLARRGGRDPYRSRTHFHVHFFAIGAVLGLLLWGLLKSRYWPALTLAAGLTPLAALVLSAPIFLWGCRWWAGPWLLWLCEGTIQLAWPILSGLLLFDLFAPQATPQR